MIVKVQTPLVTTEPEPRALVYNEDRSYEGWIQLTVDLLELMGPEPKKFFYASVDEDGILTIAGNAPWQTW